MYDSIETLLKSRGITLYAFAKMTGVNYSTIKNWKYRGGYLSYPMLCKIADALNVSLDVFRK